jgi:cellulose synthase/poly-beta-1,6-N-acetylglucosamine synthase-like glycosyltransferase
MVNNGPMITIIAINFNTSDFIELQAQAFTQLTKNSYQFWICDNGSNDQHLLHLTKIQQRYPHIELTFRLQSAPGSAGHGEALDLMMKKVRTPYVMVMDADTVMLAKDWDQKMLELFSDQVKAVGTPYEEGVGKPTDFPVNFACLYDAELFRKYHYSFAAGDFLKHPDQDQGYLIRLGFQKMGFAGTNFVMKNTRSFKEGKFAKFLCAEFYHPKTAELIACHFGRGSTGGEAKYKSGVYVLFPLISRLLRRLKGATERKQWIACARELISLK